MFKIYALMGETILHIELLLLSVCDRMLCLLCAHDKGNYKILVWCRLHSCGKLYNYAVEYHHCVMRLIISGDNGIHTYLCADADV